MTGLIIRILLLQVVVVLLSVNVWPRGGDADLSGWSDGVTLTQERFRGWPIRAIIETWVSSTRSGTKYAVEVHWSGVAADAALVFMSVVMLGWSLNMNRRQNATIQLQPYQFSLRTLCLVVLALSFVCCMTAPIVRKWLQQKNEPPWVETLEEEFNITYLEKKLRFRRGNSSDGVK